MDQKRRNIERIWIVLFDMVAVTLSLILAYFIRYRVFLGRYAAGDQSWMLVLLLVIYLVAFYLTGNIRRFFRRGPIKELFEVLKTELTMLVLLLVLVYVLHNSEDVARLMLGYFLVWNTILMLAFRQLLKGLLIRVFRRSVYTSHMILVTDRAHVLGLLEDIDAYKEWYREIRGIVLADEAFEESDGETEKSEQELVSGVPVVASYDALLEYVVHNNVDEVFFAYVGQKGMKKVPALINTLSSMGVTVNVNIDEFDLSRVARKSLGKVGKYAVVAFDRNIFSQRGLFLKRLLDIAGSLVGMAIFGLVAIVLVPAIKLTSKGPAIFLQTRVGKNGRKFQFYKFRSMYIDAEERKASLMDQNEVDGLMFKMENDPRITKVGRFIRRTSLDELPQFWNVLKGDMSLVGTRPPTVDEYERYEAKHKSRLSMKPGITGMWQVSGRSDIQDFDEVVRLDMEYIDGWNIGKDIAILFKTVGVVLGKKGSK